MSDTRSAEAERYRRLYNNRRWRKRRLYQLTAEPLCAMCAAEGRVTLANTADHVVPHRGDETLFWEGELSSLCGPCHSSRKQTFEKGGVLRAAIGVDGWPVGQNWPGVQTEENMRRVRRPM